jgi:3'(2'), 5'-bisphosphate nucleotidase
MGDIANDEAVLAVCERLALDAGRAIMEVYQGDLGVTTKADASPVTIADERAETIILDGLRAAFPGIVCVGEEEVSSGKLPPELGEAFFLVDPLDGTKEFIGRRPDFTVNIALVRAGVPVIGVVYAPAQGKLYGGRPGAAHVATVDAGFAAGARAPMAVRSTGDTLRIVASRSHSTPETDAFVDRFPGSELTSVGSSLKFCLLASGEADLYPRFGRTMEWDTAAGDAVLRAAGGVTRTPEGAPFVYGKRNQAHDSDFANGWFVAATKDAASLV